MSARSALLSQASGATEPPESPTGPNAFCAKQHADSIAIVSRNEVKKARDKMGNKKTGAIKIDGKIVSVPADLLDGPALVYFIESASKLSKALQINGSLFTFLGANRPQLEASVVPIAGPFEDEELGRIHSMFNITHEACSLVAESKPDMSSMLGSLSNGNDSIVTQVFKMWTALAQVQSIKAAVTTQPKKRKTEEPTALSGHQGRDIGYDTSTGDQTGHGT